MEKNEKEIAGKSEIEREEVYNILNKLNGHNIWNETLTFSSSLILLLYENWKG